MKVKIGLVKQLPSGYAIVGLEGKGSIPPKPSRLILSGKPHRVYSWQFENGRGRFGVVVKPDAAVRVGAEGDLE